MRLVQISRTSESESALILPAVRRIARPRAHLPGRRHFEDLHLLRCADLVVPQVAGDEERIALLDPQRAAILELQVDPALQDVNELAFALLILPSVRLAHALAR